MLGRKMAGGSVLRLIQGISNLNVYSMQWNVSSQRCVAHKAVYERLKNMVDKPKKPFNAFFEFKNDVEPEVIRRNPNLELKERIKIISQMWRDCSEEKKNKYQALARSNFEKYKLEMENLNSSLTPHQKAEIAELKSDLKRLKEERQLKVEKHKKENEFKKPKRPMNPYVRFVKAQNGLDGDKSLIQAAAAKWMKMSESEKRPYVEEFERESEIFNKKLEAWEERMIKLGHLDLVRVKKLKEKSIKE